MNDTQLADQLQNIAEIGVVNALRDVGTMMNAVERLRILAGAQEPGRWILHDVVCSERYECSNCKAVFIEEENFNCDKWAYCPACGQRKAVR